MALKKIIAGYHTIDGWVEQHEVEMHPLEEASFLAHWAIHDAQMKVIPKPFQNEEHEWLIEYGADYVKQKRDEWQKSFDTEKPNIDKAHEYHQQCTKDWHAHCEMCSVNGFDPNIHDKDKYKV